MELFRATTVTFKTKWGTSANMGYLNMCAERVTVKRSVHMINVNVIAVRVVGADFEITVYGSMIVVSVVGAHGARSWDIGKVL